MNATRHAAAPTVGEGVILRPGLTTDELAGTGLGGYLSWLAARGHAFGSYHELWSWSVTDVDSFWASLWDYFEVRGERGHGVLPDQRMPGAQWFPGTRLNYAEQVVGLAVEVPDRIAIRSRSQTRDRVDLTYAQLAEQVRRARGLLESLGVREGDRVVGYLPNIPETVVAMLATASLGAIWAVCPPEFGSRSVIDRLAQLEPTILIAVAGYTHGEKSVDRSGELATIRSALTSVRHVVGIPYGEHTVDDAVQWPAALAEQDEAAPLEFARVAFDHPLWTVFSSGTTGLPKAIVHSHGGITLEHLKLHSLHLDTRPGDAVTAITTTGWMVWNAMVGSLLVGATLVIADGNPLYPDLLEPWRVAAESASSFMGISPAYAIACRKEGLEPAKALDLSSLRTVSVTGSALSPEGYDWLYSVLPDHVFVNSMSGGTDVCSNFVAGNPWLPVYRGEISGPCLGVDVAALDEDGNAVIDQVGELVVRTPMPSMPVAFWNDPDLSRYRLSYFDKYPGIWRHGDWVTITERGSCIIHGRSDATLNRGGVRLGTSEFYGVIEDFPEIQDSLVIHLEDDDGGPGRLLLFVQPAEGHTVDATLIDAVKRALRAELSPRHVPDVVAAVPAVPRTLTGKKLETPIKNILLGKAPADVVSPGAITGYDAIDSFVRAATQPEPATR
jgi:acetoacetyl-CoA synthetase